MNIEFRKAEKGDSELAYQIKKSAFREYVEMVWGWDESFQVNAHNRRFDSQNILIVQYKGIDIGVIAIDKDPDCIKLNQLYLLPDFQNKGIGKACVEKIIKEMKPKSVPLRLRVLKVNNRALSFYMRLGFQITDSDETHDYLESKRIS